MTADDAKIAFARVLLSKWDWEGATPPLGQWQRGSDMPQFYCGRCDQPVVWEEMRKLCPTCAPLRALLREAIAAARAAPTPPADWNAALLALGRRWQAWMLIYTPEDLHDLRKEIYALWRGDGLGDDRSQQPENKKVCDAIGAGLKDP